MISREELIKEARSNDYKPEILEKVYWLLTVLGQFMQVPYLRDRLVLKGGTALNLFYFADIPRLSVDIDLNYIGKITREEMLEEKPIIMGAIHKILLQNRFELYRNPQNYAGGKMVWRYPSVLGQKGNLEIDLNYMYRQPLWPVVWLKSKLIMKNSPNISVLDIHELAAGKLTALFARNASRDIFDAHYLLNNVSLNTNQLRLGFVIYLAMSEVDLSKVTVDNIMHDTIDLRNSLLPVLRQKNLPRSPSDVNIWARKLQEELRQRISLIIPLRKDESEFIQNIRLHGKIQPDLITEEKRLTEILLNHPGLQWSVMKSERI